MILLIAKYFPKIMFFISYLILSYLILVGSFQKLEKVIEVIAHFDREGTPLHPNRTIQQ